MIYPCSLFFFQQLNFPEVLERHLGSHHLHRGLTNGWLATVWIAFLLSQANHRKVSVQDWDTAMRILWKPCSASPFALSSFPTIA